MSAQPHDASSIEDVEKKTPDQNSPSSKASVAEGQANSPNSEYERYLDLHRQFEGAGRKRLLQKLDWRLLPTLSVLYLLCSLDKSNAGNAKIFGFVTDANMTSTQFNLGLMVFFFSYGLWEPVSNVLLRRVIAYGVGHLDGSHGYTAWEWLFLIEGVITVAVGLMTIFFLPHFPHQYNETRKTSWLTATELDYAKLRVKYASGPDAPTYEFRWSDVWAAARDRKTWLMMMMFWWGGSIPTYSLSYTLPTMVKNLGYSAIRAQALTTPPYIFATIVCIFNGWEELSSMEENSPLYPAAGTIPVVAGSAGEAPHLSAEERTQLIKTARASLDEGGLQHVPIVAGIGAPSTRETIELAKKAETAGADYAMVLPPGYYGGQLGSPAGRLALTKFFIDVAEASPLPVVLYNFPAVSGGIDLDSDLIVDVVKGSDNVVGVKLTLSQVCQTLLLKHVSSSGNYVAHLQALRITMRLSVFKVCWLWRMERVNA
ncbi:MFS transporter prlL [Colletotrichum sp. SAR 10_75]|nr:MFS transporter prlL [Colletotrichum sp. SAR 10_75]